MCLGIPGRVVARHDDTMAGALMGRVDFGGVRKDVCLAYVPDVRVGEYVIVHVGFAITRVDEASARATLDTIAALGLLDGELGDGDPADGEPPAVADAGAAGAACPLPSSWSAARAAEPASTDAGRAGA